MLAIFIAATSRDSSHHTALLSFSAALFWVPGTCVYCSFHPLHSANSCLTFRTQTFDSARNHFYRFPALQDGYPSYVLSLLLSWHFMYLVFTCLVLCSSSHTHILRVETLPCLSCSSRPWHSAEFIGCAEESSTSTEQANLEWESSKRCNLM